MDSSPPLQTPTTPPQPLKALWTSAPEKVVAGLSVIVLLFSYTTVFWITGAANPAAALGKALVNVVPAALLGWLCFRLILGFVVKKTARVQVLIHGVLSLGFSVAWYLGILVVYGLEAGWMTNGLEPRAFSSVAFSWQIFQGVTLYTVVAASSYAVLFWRQTQDLRAALTAAERKAASKDQTAKPRTDRLLLRRDREIVPVDAKDIVRISGAGDRSEVFTRTGRIETSSTLTDLEAALPEGFLRVHRSHLVSLAAVLHAEPAGNGRLTLHLPDGDSVTASRAGAKAFREAAL
ncbi:MAG: LytTR family DNA-binding domain-containing protein [Pseudomonadota bacterium]